MFKKKAPSLDHGLTLPYKCSHCSSFGLTLKETPYQTSGEVLVDLIMKVWSKNKALWYFECSKCQLSIEIPENEVSEAIKLSQHAKDYYSGNLKDTEFMKILSSTSSQTVQEIYNRCNSWICDDCENEVPPTFEVCWNCGSECPVPEKLVKIDGSIQLNNFALLGSSYEFKRESE